MPDEDYRKRINAIVDAADGKDPFKDLLVWANEPDDPKRKAERFNALADWAGAHKRQVEESDQKKRWAKRQRIWRKRAKELAQKQADWEDPGFEDGGWHPEAIRTGVVSPVGSFVTSHKRLVWHSTEGSSLPSYAGTNPHFTIDAARGVLYQHQSVAGAARALVNASGGVETNRQGAIQVEIVGFAAQSQDWSDDFYAELADLARWIEAHCSVKRECSVSFPGGGQTAHLSSDAWLNYEGHCGHCSVPENEHWDPGKLDIDKVI
jgi:hypothetical protein